MAQGVERRGQTKGWPSNTMPSDNHLLNGHKEGNIPQMSEQSHMYSLGGKNEKEVGLYSSGKKLYYTIVTQ